MLPTVVWNQVRFSRALREFANVFVVSIPNK